MAKYKVTTDNGTYMVTTQDDGENVSRATSQPQTRFNVGTSPMPKNALDIIKNTAIDTGKIIANDFADVGDATRSIVQQVKEHPFKTSGQIIQGTAKAIAHPIRTAKSIGTDLKEKVQNAPNKPVSALLTMGSDALMAQGGINALRSVPKAIKSAKSIPEGINKAVSPMRDYAGNKVGVIRDGAKKYWKDEIKAYGDSIDSLAGNTSSVPSSDLMQKLTKTMVDRKLYDPLQQKWVQPLNQVDSQLVKSYKTLAREIDKGGNINISKVIKEYQRIRDSVPIDSSIGREARTVSKDVIEGIKKHINVKEFQQANARYKDFRDNFDAIDKKVDVWGNPLETGKGERFLTKGLSNTKEARLIGKSIEKKTGTTLKGAKVINAINNIPGMKLIKR